jgi:predicted dehydrogenase
MLHDSGSHMLDAAMWCTGRKPVRVSAVCDSRGDTVDIQSFVTVTLDNGANMQISVVGDADCWNERHTYWFEKATIFVQDETIRVNWSDGTRAVYDAWPKSVSPLTNFAAACFGEEPIYAPLECGLHVQMVTEGAYRSSLDGGAAVNV